MSEAPHTTDTSKPKRTLLICTGIVAIAIVALLVIYSTEPTAERETASLRRAMLVDVIEVEQSTYRPVIVETGTVAPSKEIQLAPQIGGRIVDLHPEFTPGGFIEKGDVLLRIEKADYENRLAQRQSELKQAETDLDLEMGRQDVARRDFELLGERLPEGENNLVLREPQLAAAQVRVDAAKAAVEQAKLDLERTELRSPFDAQILSRMANLGSQVSEGMPVAHIVGIDRYWVMATVAPSKLPFIRFPKGEEAGAEVELIKRSAGKQNASRLGRLYRLVGELEENTRLAKIVIQVEDPLNRQADATDLPPLLVGEFLEVRITGKPLENVVRMPLDYLRKNDTAWVMSGEGKLEIRKLEILFKDANHAYVLSGLSGGERIVTSNLSRVTEGAELRTKEESSTKAAE